METQKIIESINANYDNFVQMSMKYLPKVFLAILTLIIGLKIIGFVKGTITKALSKRSVDESLMIFIGNLIGLMLKLALGIAVIDMVGIQTTSFVAMLGAAGLAVGLALQGSLSNFAGGVLILLFRPFKTGDYILAQGEEGTVQKIDVFNTWLNKLDNRRVILPNGPLASGTIVNVTAEEIRRVDLPVGVSYNSNIDQVKGLLIDLAKKDSRILEDPAPFVGLQEMADSAVVFTFRVWCKCEDYWGVFFDTNEAIKKGLDAASISIPFPQRDVHLYTHDN